MTKRTGNRVKALWLLAAAVSAAGALAPIGCSSGPSGSGVDVPDPPDSTEKPAAAQQQRAECSLPNEGCACEDGQFAECGETLAREGASVTCALGTRRCENKVWGSCGRENVVTRLIPVSASGYSTMGLGSPKQCANNPCDPYCYAIQDDGDGGIDAGSPLKLADGGVTLDGKPKPPPPQYNGLLVTTPQSPIIVTGIPQGQYPITNPANPVQFQAQYTPVTNPPSYTPAIWSLDAYDYSLINGAGKLTVVTAVPHRPLVKATASNFNSTFQAEVIVDVVEADPAVPQSILDQFNQAPPPNPGPQAQVTTKWSEPFANNSQGWTLDGNPPPPPPPDEVPPPPPPEALLKIQTAKPIPAPDNATSAPKPGARTAAEPKVQPAAPSAQQRADFQMPAGMTRDNAPKTTSAAAKKYKPELPVPEHLEPLPAAEPGGGSTRFQPLAAHTNGLSDAPLTPLEAAATERLATRGIITGNAAQLADEQARQAGLVDPDGAARRQDIASTLIGAAQDGEPPPPPPCNGSYNASKTFTDRLSSTTMTVAWDGANYWSSSGGSNSGARYAKYDANGNLLATYAPGLDFRSIFSKEGNGSTVYARQFNSPWIYKQTSPGVFATSVALSGGVLDAQAAVVYNTGSTEFDAFLGGIVYRWNTSGTYLGSVTLSGFGGVAAENQYPQNRGIAVVGGYYLTYSNQILSVWNSGGTRLSQSTLNGAGTSFDSHFSLSYANGLVWIVDVAGGTWRGYDLSACLGGGGNQQCTHPLFDGGPRTYSCPTGATKFTHPGNLDPTSSDQAKMACEACYGVGKCYLEWADCAGPGWGPRPPGNYICDQAYFGYTSGCSGDDGRSWPICMSWSWNDYGHWGKPAADDSCYAAPPPAQGGTCTHPLFDGAPVNFTCPTGAKSFTYTGNLDPTSSDQAKAACEACYGVGKCFLEFADCAGPGWGPSPPWQYICYNAYFGYQSGCSGDDGRSWPICYSWADQGYGHWGKPAADSNCNNAQQQNGTCTHPLFSAPAELTYNCPTGAKTWTYQGNLDPSSSDQAKAACEACYGVGKCYLEWADCAGPGWGPRPPGQYACYDAYFGYTSGCSGDEGRTWPICYSWSWNDYGYWGKPPGDSKCAPPAAGCTHPLFSNGGGYACPTGATSFSFQGALDPSSSDQAKAACEACYGVGKCYLEFADCAGGGWGPNPAGHYQCGKAYFGYQNGCSGDNGRSWAICNSYNTYGWWGKPAAAAVCNGVVEWQIGAPKASSGETQGNPDPGSDHGGNNGVAGVVLGGDAAQTPHGFAYLTSPAINTSGYTTATLNFWRWLNSDAAAYMVNTVDAYNGSAWTNIWTSGTPGDHDAAWNQQAFDVTAFKNAGFKFRFGFKVLSNSVAKVSSWNIDDVAMTDTVIIPAPPADTRILYPYAKTVFPRSFTPPVLQWDSPTGKNAQYVKYCLRFNDPLWPSQPGKQTFSWCYVMGEPNPKRGSFPTRAWSLFETTASGKDAKITLQRIYNGAQLPQVEVPIHFSSAPMRGNVYYWQINTGSVNRINQDGSLSQNFLATGGRCIACHAVSADGTTLVAQMDGGNGPGGAFNTGNGSAIYWRNGVQVQFQAVSPNGAWTMWGEYPLYLSPTNSSALSNSFYAAQAGRVVANPGWSPLGNYIGYASRINSGWYVDYYNADLGLIQVNPATGAFSNNHIIVAAPGGDRPIVTYPTFTPDDKYIVYQTANAIRTRGNYGNLWLTDTNGNAPTQLKQAEGIGYLDDVQLNISYEPTFSPTASGGYYWLVFVSNRDYGNTVVNAAPRKDNGVKQLWVTAIDQNPVLGQDPSHPAFWLAGQQTNNNNMRGAFAKAACTKANAACQWNEDCCGYNPQDPANSTAKCVISQPVSLPITRTCTTFVPGQCKADGTACAVDTDCCGYPTSSCIQGLCKVPAFIQYAPGTFTRDFDPQCPSGTHVTWSWLNWTDYTPGDSNIVFDVQFADTIAGLNAAPHIPVITQQGAPCLLSQSGNFLCGATLNDKQGNPPKGYMRMNATLNPSSDLTQAPILQSWAAQYDCQPTF
jgi:hypothetical protein